MAVIFHVYFMLWCFLVYQCVSQFCIALGRWTKYCNLLVSLSVCCHIKNHSPKFPCYLWPWLGVSLTIMQYALYFGFVDVVMISHNGSNGPESKKRMFSLQGGNTTALVERQTMLCLF